MKINLLRQAASSLNIRLFKILMCFASVFIVFGAASIVEAQDNPNTRWSFVYADRFPHQNWGCTFQAAGCDDTYPEPETKIAYASDGYTATQNGFISHLDKKVFATLHGGLLFDNAIKWAAGL